MKQLKEYIKEGLFDDIDKLEGKNSLASNAKQLKKEIVDWVSDNYYISYARKSIHKLKKRTIEVDMTTVPPTVNYNYDLYASNDLTSLNNDGMFQWGKVDGSFSCNKCKLLKTLEGAPKIVTYDFTCSHCNSLKTLEGCPEEVGRRFSCSFCNSITSLKGCPENVGGNFECIGCNQLKTLEGCPKDVGYDFECLNCSRLISLKGAPKEVGKDFACCNCGAQFTEEDVKKVSNVKGKINIR